MDLLKSPDRFPVKKSCHKSLIKQACSGPKHGFLLSPRSIGNPGSLCVTRDIGKYREFQGLKICWKMEIKIYETYHVASC